MIRAYTAGEIRMDKAAQMMGVYYQEMTEIWTEGGSEIRPVPRTVRLCCMLWARLPPSTPDHRQAFGQPTQRRRAAVCR